MSMLFRSASHHAVHCRRKCDQIATRTRHVMRAKMYVPSDSFGGISPEKKASQALLSLFTFISAKIVLAQLEGSGRGALAAYNQEQYQVLFSHLQEASLSDPHAWLEQLMRKDKAVALRLMEVRDAYSRTDFEWDQLQRLSTEAVKKSNLQLMRQAAAASLQATVDREPQPVPAAEQQQQEQAGTAHKPSAGSISSNSSGTDSRASKEESSAAASSSGTNQGSALQPGAGPAEVPPDNIGTAQRDTQQPDQR